MVPRHAAAHLQVLVNAAVSFGLGVAGHVHVTEQLGLFAGLVGPHAGQRVVGGGVLVQEVHGEHAEQQGASAAQEHDVVVLGNAHEVAEELFGFFEHAFDGL